MKVLLMIQNGDGRPKCAKQFGADKARALQYVERLAGERFWLVECERASSGRTCIEATVHSVKYGPGPSVHFDYWSVVAQRHGRIIAQGGKA